MRLPSIYAIVDTAAYEARGLLAVKAAGVLLECGIKLLQYRHKGQFTEERFQEARQIAAASEKAGARFILNDRSDYAKLLGCGVHLGQDDLSAADARKILGEGAIIGLSTHNQQQLEEAASLSVDYVALGPVFHTASKARPDPMIGLEEIARLRALSRRPLVAIGGITMESALRVLDSGADAVAVISGLLPPDHGDWDGLFTTVRKWLERVEE